MKPILTLVAILALGASASAQQQPAEVSKAMAPLQGSWALVLPEKMPPGSPKEILLTITGDRYAQVVDGKVSERGTMKIDTASKPMTVDLSITEGDDANKLQVGLIEVSGSTMTLHLAMPGGAARPKSMQPEQGFILFTMKKTK